MKWPLGARLFAWPVRPRVLAATTNGIIKEGAEEWIPAGIEIANEFVSPAVEPREVASNYRKDAALWEVLHRLRRADRW